METIDKSLLLGAVNTLVQIDDASELYRDLMAFLPTAARLEARFSGHRAILNPLVELALADREKFDNIIGLIEHKRAAAGLSPLVEENGGFDKTDYMREFMQQKRERERRAAKIENMMRPERDRLVGRSRLDFMQAQANKWKERRDEALERAREARGGARLPKKDMEDVLTAFWQTIDRELDELEELAYAERYGKKKPG